MKDKHTNKVKKLKSELISAKREIAFLKKHINRLKKRVENHKAFFLRRSQ